MERNNVATTKSAHPSSKRPLHFDVFGSLEHVLASIDHMVPRVFKGEDLSFIPILKRTIRLHTLEHKWDIVVLSLSKGMAREELDVILNHLPEHEGPLIIDATASTPEHDVIYNQALLNSRKERIIRLNDETSDVMVVLYGIEGIDPPMERKLLMRRMHYMGVTLDLLIERNEDIEGGANEEGITGTLQQAMRHLRSIYAHDSSEEAQPVQETAGQAFMALSALVAAYKATQSEFLKDRLEILASEIKELPLVFKTMNLSYEPLVNAANELQAKQVEAYRPAQQLENRPEIPDLLENNHSAVDGLQSTPGALNELLNNAQAMNNLENTPNSTVLQNNPVIKEKVVKAHKQHIYDQITPKLDPN